MKRVGIIVIGNEVLSGKVSDINSTWLMAELRSIGRDVGRVAIIPDELDVIAEQVLLFSSCFDPVFTSGGVGPTHDDKTFAGVARAFDVPLERDARLEAIIRQFYGDKLEPAHLRMALVPRGTELIFSTGLLFPVTRMRNVHILPGDPAVLRKKFSAIREGFRDRPVIMRRIFTRLDEGKIADLMADVEARYPGLLIGSYPVYGNPDFAVQITVESRQADDVARAFVELATAIGPSEIWKTD